MTIFYKPKCSYDKLLRGYMIYTTSITHVGGVLKILIQSVYRDFFVLIKFEINNPFSSELTSGDNKSYHHK